MYDVAFLERFLKIIYVFFYTAASPVSFFFFLIHPHFVKKSLRHTGKSSTFFNQVDLKILDISEMAQREIRKHYSAGLLLITCYFLDTYNNLHSCAVCFYV